MRNRWQRMLIAALISVCVAGCGQKPSPIPARAAPAQKPSVPLPEWAPKNPSPEFLRAAKVLKPWAIDDLLTATEGNLEHQARLKRGMRLWPAAYEFFGALTDEQTQHFISTGTVRIPVKSLSAKQRSALDNWFEAYRKNMAGLEIDRDDYLVVLYRGGAREDLSNVEVGFSTATGGGHLVKIRFWIGGGSNESGMGITFATI